MEITRQADYALRAVLDITGQPTGQRATTAGIAERQHIPPSFLAKIISQLSVAGIVQTTRGPHGGVRLARSPAEVSMLDVIEAVDGPIILNTCVTDPDACHFGISCVMHDIWCQAQADLAARLRESTFAKLIDSAPLPANHTPLAQPAAQKYIQSVMNEEAPD